MSCHTKGLVNWRRKFNYLIVILDIPKTNSAIAWDGYYVALGNMEIHRKNWVGVRTNQSSISLVRFIKYSQTSIQSSTNHSQTISTDICSTNCSFMLSFHKEFRKIKRPNSQELVIWACNAKSLINRDWVNCRVVSSVCSFQSFSSVINLEDHSVFWSNKNSL